MKGNAIDDLFKQKLDNHQQTPSQGVWDQIEGNLQENKGTSVKFWLKIAAGLILICTLTWLLLPDNQSSTNEVALNSTEVTQEEAASDIAPVKIDQPDPVLIDKTFVTGTTQKAPALDEAIPTKISNSIDNNNLITTAPVEAHSERQRAFVDIPLLKIDQSMAEFTQVSLASNYELKALDISFTLNYGIDVKEEGRIGRKNRMFSGIVSLAKGVNKTKLGFEGIRNAKNGFVNDELKYGVKETTEEEVVDPDTKDSDLNK